MGCFGFGRKSPTIGDDDGSVENCSTHPKRPGSSGGSSSRPLRTQSSLGPRGSKGEKNENPRTGALSRATSAPAISTSPSSQTFLLSGNGSIPQSPSTPSARAPPPMSPSAATQAGQGGLAATAALLRSTSAADASSLAVSSPTGSMARARNGGSSSMSRIAMLQQRQQQQQITNLHPLPPPVGEAIMKAADDDRLASPGSGKAKATSPTSVCTNSHLSASSSSVSSASSSSPPMSSAAGAGGSGRDLSAAPRNTFGPTGSSSTAPSCPSSGGSVVGPLGDERSGAGAIAASADAAAATAAVAAAAGTSTSGTPGLSIQAFPLAFLEEITNGFSAERLLGEGGFGPVFLGMMPKSALGGSAAAGEGKAKVKGKKWTDRVKGQTSLASSPSKKEDVVPVAIKALRSGGHQGEREFLAEVQYLGHLSHPHLVNLLGYCADGPERLLVYEYLANGSLEFKLFDHDEEEKTEEDGGSRQPMLTWHQRIQVAIGAAKGLAYLHEGAEHQVIYRDFKTSNILLDADMNAKLADFGLARSGPDGEKSHVSTRIVGTIGYAAPEYVLTGHLTAKSDVWAFGVVLLELLTGRLALDKSRPREEQSLVEWAEPYLGNPSRLYRIMDPNLNGMYSVRGAQMAAAVAHKCLNKRPKQRPKMSEVVAALEPVLAFHDTVGVLSRQVGSQTLGLPAGGALAADRPAAAAAAGGSRRA